MLRLRERSHTRMLAATTLPTATVEILPVFEEPLLEVVRLLREAANIEHALMLQYLFAAFSVKDRYRLLAGEAAASGDTVLGVAIQEMRHLAEVNSLLVALRVQPNLDREDFPFRTDLYPFVLELEPLTRRSLAKYVTAESPPGALDPATAPSDAERMFREAIRKELGNVSVNHIGSLYGTVIDRLRQAVSAEPGLLPDVDERVSGLQHIREQGEGTHFQLFRSVFEATHPAFEGARDVWADPAAELYPSRPLPRNPTAYPGAANSITDPRSRDLAWLSNLHYWLVLGLLYLGHLATDAALIGRAQLHMVNCLHPLALALAAGNVGMPFDPLALNVGLGPDRDSNRSVLRRLVGEIRQREREAGDALPPTYSTFTTKLTLTALGG